MDECLVADRRGEEVRVEQADSDYLRVKNLENCTLVITSALKTVYLNDLRSCKVLIFPVENSIFGDGLRDCDVRCCAQQIRVHHSHGSRFGIFVSSAMIIEDRWAHPARGSRWRRWTSPAPAWSRASRAASSAKRPTAGAR